MKINFRASSLHAATVGMCNSFLQLVAAFGAPLTGAENVAITSCVNSALVLLSVLVIMSTNGNGVKSG